MDTVSLPSPSSPPSPPSPPSPSTSGNNNETNVVENIPEKIVQVSGNAALFGMVTGTYTQYQTKTMDSLS